MTETQIWFQLGIGGFQFVAALGTLLILHQSNKLNKRSVELTERLKKWDMLMGFDKRWDRLIELRETLQNAEQNKIDLYYKRYWEFQYNQYLLWEKGLIDGYIFYRWMSWRHDDWALDEELGKSKYKYQQSWKAHSKRFNDTGFTKFMELVFTKGAKEAIDRHPSGQSTKQLIEAELKVSKA